MILSEIEKQHLLNRSIFGKKLNVKDFPTSMDSQKLIEHLFNTYKPHQAFDIIRPEISMDLIGGKMKVSEERKLARKKSNLSFRALNIAWLKAMFNNNNPLNDRMAFFWHGHFACRSNNSYHMQQYLNVVRKNALGNFGILLMEVSKTPAMLSFLNNQQNKVEHPNENFAREVMELFTLGIGHYTEEDVKEGARAFTGWAYTRTTDAFDFKEKFHDKGEKNFLGKKGHFNGDDIIALLLKEKQTAQYIAEKVWKHFVNETINKSAVNQLANVFYDSNYDIPTLMIALFTSKAFYDKENIGALVKSPIELIVMNSRQLNLDWLDDNALLKTQRLLGQVLMLPPNVAGWKGGKAWIDTASLTFRMDLPHALLVKNTIKAEAKEEVEVFEMENNKALKKNKYKKIVAIDWLEIEKVYGATFKNQTLENTLLAKKSRQSNYYQTSIKESIISIMSLPEYQLT